jgi:hypothetical protein
VPPHSLFEDKLPPDRGEVERGDFFPFFVHRHNPKDQPISTRESSKVEKNLLQSWHGH